MSINLLSLPHPVTFVIRYPERWPELFDSSEISILDPSSLHSRIQTNEECWILVTYLYLKQKYLNVSISDRFIPGQICVISSLDLGIKDRTFNCFIVVVAMVCHLLFAISLLCKIKYVSIQKQMYSYLSGPNLV